LIAIEPSRVYAEGARQQRALRAVLLLCGLRNCVQCRYASKERPVWEGSLSLSNFSGHEFWTKDAPSPLKMAY